MDCNKENIMNYSNCKRSIDFFNMDNSTTNVSTMKDFSCRYNIISGSENVYK